MNLIISNTATRCPDVRFIFSHAGGTLVSIAGRFLGDALSAQALSRPPDPHSRPAPRGSFPWGRRSRAGPFASRGAELEACPRPPVLLRHRGFHESRADAVAE